MAVLQTESIDDPPVGAAEFHTLPFEVKTFPDVPGAILEGTVISPDPSKATPLIVFVAASLVAVAAFPPIDRFVTGVVLVTENGDVPIDRVDIICPSVVTFPLIPNE